MTTINITVENKATKQKTVVARFKAKHSRPHGRPGNVGRQVKLRRLAIPNQTRGAEGFEKKREVSHPLGVVEAQPPRKIKNSDRIQKEI